MCVPFFVPYALSVICIFGVSLHLYRTNAMSRNKVFLAHCSLIVIVMVIWSMTIKRTLFDDIERITAEMIESQTKGIEYLFSIPTYRISPLSALVIYIIGQTHQYYLLQGIAALLYYGSISFLFWTIYKTLKVDYRAIYSIYLLVIAFSNFPAIVFGVRNSPAIALCISSIVCYELTKNKPILYFGVAFLGCLFHFQAWIILLVYIMSVKTNGIIRRLFYFACSIYGFIAVPLAEIFYLLVPNNTFVHDIRDKVNYYFWGGKNFTIYVSPKQLMRAYAIVLLCIFSLILFNKIKKKFSSKNDLLLTNLNHYSSGTGFICVGSLPGGTPITRFSSVFFLSSVVLFVFNIDYFLHKKSKIVMLILGFIIFVLFLAQAWTTQSMYIQLL